MKDFDSLIVFALEGRRYALPLSDVDKVLRVMALTQLPKAPDIVLGVVNIRGQVIPVVDMRRRFHLPGRGIALTDQLIVAHTARRPVALIADAVLDVIAYPAQNTVAAEDILPDIEYVEGVAKLADGLILIHDLDKFLSLEEENALDHALEAS